ncbi:MAG: hypothetical protein VX344_02600 [Bacteroidota bacterium]|nr:hypothetical protein [Bacteroidota bacterium]
MVLSFPVVRPVASDVEVPGSLIGLFLVSVIAAPLFLLFRLFSPDWQTAIERLGRFALVLLILLLISLLLFFLFILMMANGMKA